MKKPLLGVGSFKECISKNNIPDNTPICLSTDYGIYVITNVTYLRNKDETQRMLILHGEIFDMPDIEEALASGKEFD